MRGHVRQRNKGSWELHYDLPPDTNGRRRQKTETIKGSKAEAPRLVRERLAAVEIGLYVGRQRETVGQFMFRWLNTYASTNTTLRTQEGYRGNVTRYIIPAIGGVELQKLTAAQIQGLYAGMLRCGLSNRTALHVHRVLRKALQDGVKWGSLARNMADAATPPRPERKQLEMWDTKTINEFLEAASESRFHGLYHLAILTGMRRSELCGLKWDNVELVTGRLSVANTLQRISGKSLVEGQPKTPRSRRSISLSPAAVSSLHTVRGQQIEQSLAAGLLWQNTGFVFTQIDGTPVDPESVTRDFSAIVRKTGLPHLTLHGLRHAHATLMLTAGVHAKVVSERLGHSSIAVTMDTYSHVLPGLQEEAALLLDEILLRGRRSDTK